MEKIALFIAVISMAAVANAGTKYYRGNTDDYLLNYDISVDIDKAPVDWSDYMADEAKWRRKYGGEDGKAATLNTQILKSPGCVTEQGNGDHVKVYLLKYKNPGLGDKVASRWKLVTTFSDTKKGNSDGNRKTAQRSVMFYCGVIGEAHGITIPSF